MAKHNEAPQTLAEFNAALAAALWTISKAKQVRKSAGEMFDRFGFTIPAGDGTDAMPEFEVAGYVPSDDYIGEGMSAADLSEEKQAEREAKRLQTAKRTAYRWLREQAVYAAAGYDGYVPAEHIIRHLPSLGLLVPAETTDVTLRIQQGDNATYITATLPGRVTVEEAVALAEGKGYPSESQRLAQAVFGKDAVPDEPTVTGTVQTSLTWPDASEIK
jgi:hypothetical protein